VLAAQGDLEFAAGERLLWAIDEALAGHPAGLVLDLHRVTRLHHVAERMLDVRLTALVEGGTAVALVHQGDVAAAVAAGARFAERDAALAWCRAAVAP
jgi:hypothetical protein